MRKIEGKFDEIRVMDDLAKINGDYKQFLESRGIKVPDQELVELVKRFSSIELISSSFDEKVRMSSFPEKNPSTRGEISIADWRMKRKSE